MRQVSGVLGVSDPMRSARAIRRSEAARSRTTPCSRALPPVSSRRRLSCEIGSWWVRPYHWSDFAQRPARADFNGRAEDDTW